MPVNKNAFLRYRILDELLSNKYKSYTIIELLNAVNDKLTYYLPTGNPIVRRTLEKDLKFLVEDSGLDVELSKEKIDGKQYISYADKNYSIFKKELTNNEKALLKGAFSLLGSFDGLPEFAGLEALRGNLQVNEERRIIYLSKNPIENTNLLGELYSDILNKTPIKITYKRFGKNMVEEDIVLHPQYLKEYNMRWFLFALIEGAESHSLFCFGLERMVEIERCTNIDYKEYNGDFEEYFDDIVGVTNYIEEPVNHIEFWVDDNAFNYITTKPIHDSQKRIIQKEPCLRAEHPALSGGAFFSIDCKYNYELVRELCSFGPQLIVLSPAYIRDKVTERIAAMMKAYKESQFSSR